MLEIAGDLWKFHKLGNWVVITTNASVRRDGCNVMGKGTALQAKNRFPNLPELIGDLIKKEGNRVQLFPEIKLATFPVKLHWSHDASLTLIKRSAEELAKEFAGVECLIYMVRPGCGNGNLYWEEVKKTIDFLDDRFIIVERPDVLKQEAPIVERVIAGITFRTGDRVKFRVRNIRGLYAGRSGFCSLESFHRVPKPKSNLGRPMFRPGDVLVIIKPDGDPSIRFQPSEIEFAPLDSDRFVVWG